jgi:hypothetical protein
MYCQSKSHIVGIILNRLAPITFQVHSTYYGPWSGLRHYDSATPSTSDRCKLIRSCWKSCHMQVVCVAFSKHETPLRVVSLSYFPVFHNSMCLMLIFCRRILRIGFPIHFFVPYITKHVPYLKKKYYFFLKFLLLYIIYKKNAETSSSTILTNKKTIYWTHYINNICHCFISLIYSQTGFYYYHWVYPSAGGLIDPEGIIRPVVCVSAMIHLSLKWAVSKWMKLSCGLRNNFKVRKPHQQQVKIHQIIFQWNDMPP